ncbi:lipopolysaccharide biosynthesis protein [Rhizobiaceae bacterium n13]|uniref:Lipopolysaccharide biosynthesis protein n=1 Tax=Ferirhizobium litorale TaxID=2927786 RepID=A0AAE3U0Z3_9HYPH|nr:lipopolysaccharide biosynthesis protein [Fererhizobium litorale]MDI7861822.1 lipopolysaccharide biosynthesis protein [Fererhizobium litorale]MDI7921836.1 lipopolysaccharide biosynthesis protein [Fererhizobium litorale]
MTKSIVANSISNAFAGMALLVSGFLSSIVVARLLGPESSGVIAFSLWIATTGALLCELGTGITLQRILPQLKVRGYSDAERRGFAAYLAPPMMLATIIAIAIYGASAWEAEEMNWLETAPSVAVLTGVLLFVQSIGSYAKSYLIGEQRLPDFLRLTVVASLLQLVVVAAGAAMIGVEGALVGYIAAQLVLFAFATTVVTARRNACGIGSRYLVSTSLILFFEYLLTSVFLNRPELLFLQQFHDVESVGFYAVGLSLANLALQLPLQLTGSLLPYYAEKRELANGHMPHEVFEGVVRSLAYLTLPMCFGLAAIATPLVTIVYGEAFGPTGSIVAILALLSPASVFLQLCTQLLFSMDRARARLVIASIGAVAMVGGCLAVIPYWGGAGAAAVRGGVFMLMCILMVRALKFDRSPKSMYLAIGRIASAAAVCGGVAYGIAEVVPGMAGLLLAIGGGALAYLVALRLFGAVASQDVVVIRQIIERFPTGPRRLSAPIIDLVAPVRT